jgi:Zn-dependent alcohol dehydrogenase
VSCGATTGWGAAVNAAAVRPREKVLVMGRVGVNAVQGAAHAGAAHVVAVDPVDSKRETALEVGATHALQLDYYRSGHLRLDELITARYSVAQAYADMYAGRNLRDVVIHEH